MTGSTKMILNPDHVTIAVADAGPAIEFFALLGFRKDHVATIDGGEPAAYMGMPDMKAQHITLVLEGAEPHFEIQLLEFDPTPGDRSGRAPDESAAAGLQPPRVPRRRHRGGHRAPRGQRRDDAQRRDGLHQPQAPILRRSRRDHARAGAVGRLGARERPRPGARWCAERTTQEAVETLGKAMIPAGPVLSPQQAFDHRISAPAANMEPLLRPASIRCHHQK